jgi:imidazolonepropionase-like amidohydrolase
MKKLCAIWLFAAVLFATIVHAEVIVIENATVMTVSHGTFKGSVLVRDGKIAEVAEKIMIPQGATVIDASGQFVMPGIVDCHSHIAVDGNVNEGSVAVSSMVNIKDVIDPEDIAIYRAMAGGVTSANILHGSANPIGGQTLVLKMRWGKSAQELIFEGATPGIKFALGENPKRPGNPVTRGNATPATARYPATRLGVEETIRTTMTEAKEYKAAWDAYQSKIARGEAAIPPRTDLRLEPLKEVLEGKRFVHAHSYRADEILMLLRVADEFGFKIRTLQHGLEAYKVAKEIAAHGAGVSTFSDWWAYKVEAIDAIPYNAAILQKKGVVVSLNSDDEELMRRLNTEASKVLKYGGLTENEALAMITLNPAKQLGIDDRVGSIDTGKDADLVVYDKNPLSQFAKVQKVLIDGTVYFDRDREVSARPGKETEKNRLIEKEKQNQPAPPNSTTPPANSTAPPARKPA